jgi:hypothetical protein
VAIVTTTREESASMLLIDCPLCAGPASLVEASDALDCQACGVQLELAPDPVPALAAA